MNRLTRRLLVFGPALVVVGVLAVTGQVKSMSWPTVIVVGLLLGCFVAAVGTMLHSDDR